MIRASASSPAGFPPGVPGVSAPQSNGCRAGDAGGASPRPRGPPMRTPGACLPGKPRSPCHAHYVCALAPSRTAACPLSHPSARVSRLAWWMECKQRMASARVGFGITTPHVGRRWAPNNFGGSCNRLPSVLCYRTANAKRRGRLTVGTQVLGPPRQRNLDTSLGKLSLQRAEVSSSTNAWGAG